MVGLKHFFCSLVIIFSVSFAGACMAHNKVVVIPMAGEDAISHPVVKTYTNSIGMQFNELPAGSFIMGSPEGEPGRTDTGDRKEDQHTVTLSKAFQMQTTEVTQAQYQVVVGSNPSHFSATGMGADCGLNCPVESVSWDDAQNFIILLNVRENRTNCNTQPNSCYSLPTEAQWEYAARADTIKAYANPIGFDDADIETGPGFNGNLHAMAWYHHNSGGMGYASGTKPVAKKQSNAWGLYDMHGNVGEWNLDWFAVYSGNATDPSGPASGAFRVVRGGDWNVSATHARSAKRSFNSPNSRSFYTGFRLVLHSGQ